MYNGGNFMGRIIIILICLLGLVSCQNLSGVWYGDIPPNELSDMVYQDGYILGKYLIRNDPEKANHIVESMQSVNDVWILTSNDFAIIAEELLDQDDSNAIIYYAIHRLINRLGYKYIKDKIVVDSPNIDLTNQFWIGMYKGIKSETDETISAN